MVWKHIEPFALHMENSEEDHREKKEQLDIPYPRGNVWSALYESGSIEIIEPEVPRTDSYPLSSRWEVRGSHTKRIGDGMRLYRRSGEQYTTEFQDPKKATLPSSNPPFPCEKQAQRP